MKPLRTLGALALLLALSTTAALAAPQQDGDEKKDEARVSGFVLADLDGKEHALADHDGKIVVIEWTNKDCPYVKRHYRDGGMQKLARDYADKGVVWLSIDSTKSARVDRLKAWVKEMEIAYPILLDADGTVARAWGAQTTPHMYVVKDGKKLYDGAIDDARTGEATVNYVAKALDEILAGKEVETRKTVPYGCSLKLAPEKKGGDEAGLGVWMTDYEAALKLSRKTGKPILADFTGSDWCGWCIRLKDEVFDKEGFKSWAKKNVVLLELDFPRKTQLPEELKKQNQELAKTFNVQGYPTIVFIDAKGGEIGRYGYDEGGPEVWTAKADEILKKGK